MRKPIFVDPNTPLSVESRLGSGIEAWVFGSVARGEAHDGSDLDVYVSGPAAERVELQYLTSRPPTNYEGETYPLHVIGPSTVNKDDFLKCQPEAKEIL